MMEIKSMMSMRLKFVATVTFLLFASIALAEEARLEPTQNPDAPYRLFNSEYSTG
jgi:hypothetical protein